MIIPGDKYAKQFLKKIDLRNIRSFCIKAADKYENTYISGNRIFTTHDVLFQQLLSKRVFDNWWESQTQWSLREKNPLRYDNQATLLKEHFIPLLTEHDTVFDVASASGDWSFFIAPYVKEVNGFELSTEMVVRATKDAAVKGIKNVSFLQTDITTYQIEKQYDHGMCLGLFTYIFRNDVMDDIVNKMYEILPDNSYLVTKDTLNHDDRYSDQNLYMYNFSNGYNAIFRSQKNYYDFFNNVGFKVYYERNLEIVSEDTGLGRVSRAVIWKKE